MTITWHATTVGQLKHDITKQQEYPVSGVTDKDRYSCTSLCYGDCFRFSF